MLVFPPLLRKDSFASIVRRNFQSLSCLDETPESPDWGTCLLSMTDAAGLKLLGTDGQCSEKVSRISIFQRAVVACRRPPSLLLEDPYPSPLSMRDAAERGGFLSTGAPIKASLSSGTPFSFPCSVPADLAEMRPCL